MGSSCSSQALNGHNFLRSLIYGSHASSQAGRQRSLSHPIFNSQNSDLSRSSISWTGFSYVSRYPQGLAPLQSVDEKLRIRTIAWNPTGYLIATGSADRTLRIWNPDKPQVKNSTELRGHTGAIERVAWNPTKEAELASVSNDGTCRFWDVRSKTCTAVVPLGGEGLTVCWSADGEVVMAGRKVTTHQDILAV